MTTDDNSKAGDLIGGNKVMVDKHIHLVSFSYVLVRFNLEASVEAHAQAHPR